MANSTRFYYNTRYILPIMIGIIVGFGLSLLCTPFYYCENSSFNFRIFRSANMSLSELVNVQKQQYKLYLQQQFQLDDFEPRINLEGKPKGPQKPFQKLVRPRHTSVELGIRNKLFVGVLSKTRMLSPLASYLNQTLSAASNKATFFINNAEMSEKRLLETTPPGVKVVNFNDDRDHLLAFHSLKYVIDNYIDTYDWFFFVTDETFIRANKLLELVNHLSITQELYMGNVAKPNESIYCAISSGIIFSNNVLRKLLPNMEWCIKNSYSEDPSDNIGRCVLHSTNLPCVNKANGQLVNFYTDSNFNFDTDIDQLIYLKGFNNSITISKVNNIENMKKLEIYFNAVETDEINEEIEKLEKTIYETVCETPEGCESLTWPLGVRSAYRPINRHEVIRWDYFNRTHIFLGNDFDSVEELTENYRYDIEESINSCIKSLNEKFNRNKYVFKSLLNGYKQFDPTRGAAYIFDFILFDVDLGLNLHKRVDFIRPFGNIEIIPMPYVTEAHKINLIVEFSIQSDLKSIEMFFTNFEKLITVNKDAADKICLYAVYFNSTTEIYRLEETKLFDLISSKVDSVKKTHPSLMKTTSHIKPIEVKIKDSNQYLNSGYRKLSIVEQISDKIPSNELIFIGSSCMEIKQDFLNRVRLNTIRGTQVFFPVPFSEYSPAIVNVSPFQEIDINKNIGHFDPMSFEFVGFFNSDFKTTRNKFMFSRIQKEEIPDLKRQDEPLSNYFNDLYELFASNSNLYILRSTDQSLKCRWSLNERCSNDEACLKLRETKLGTKSQLASHLIKNLDSLI